MVWSSSSSSLTWSSARQTHWNWCHRCRPESICQRSHISHISYIYGHQNLEYQSDTLNSNSTQNWKSNLVYNVDHVFDLFILGVPPKWAHYLLIRQPLRLTLNLSPKVGWKWKWSNMGFHPNERITFSRCIIYGLSVFYITLLWLFLNVINIYTWLKSSAPMHPAPALKNLRSYFFTKV